MWDDVYKDEQKIRFELLDTPGSGWEFASLPDNHKVRFVVDGQSIDSFASLRDICRVYHDVKHRKEAKMMIGTGSDVTLSKINDKCVKFDLSGLQTKMSYQKLEEKLYSLIGSIFRELDERDERDEEGNERRDEELDNLSQWLSDHEIWFDVKCLYTRHTSPDSD